MEYPEGKCTWNSREGGGTGRFDRWKREMTAVWDGETRQGPDGRTSTRLLALYQSDHGESTGNLAMKWIGTDCPISLSEIMSVQCEYLLQTSVEDPAEPISAQSWQFEMM